MRHLQVLRDTFTVFIIKTPMYMSPGHVVSVITWSLWKRQGSLFRLNVYTLDLLLIVDIYVFMYVCILWFGHVTITFTFPSFYWPSYTLILSIFCFYYDFKDKTFWPIYNYNNGFFVLGFLLILTESPESSFFLMLKPLHLKTLYLS